MGLRQETEQKKVEQGAEAKSKTQGTKKTTLSKDTDWRENDQEGNKFGYRSRIQQGA